MLGADWQICVGLARQALLADFAPKNQMSLLRIRQKRWRNLVDYAIRHAPYYARLAEAMSHPEDRYHIESWPILTKETIFANFDAMCTFSGPRWKDFSLFLERDRDPMHLFDNRFVVLHSSGTSGQPLIMPFTLGEWAHGCGLLFRHIKPQFRRRVAFIGACRGHFAGISMASNSLRAVAKMWHSFQAFDFNSPSSELCQQLQQYQPHIIYGYGKAMTSLAEWQESGRLHLNPQAIYSAGESLNSGEGLRCENLLKTNISEIYAATEHLVMGYRASLKCAWQFYDDAFIFECQPTCTYVTNLQRYSLPLIRYRMDDILPAGDGSIIGRMEQALWLRNDAGDLDFIHPIILAEVYLENVVRFQYVRESEQSLAFHLQFKQDVATVAKTAVKDQAQQMIREILRQKAMNRVTLSIVEHSHIAGDSVSGKYRLVVADRGRE